MWMTLVRRTYCDGKMTFSGLVSYYHLCFYKVKPWNIYGKRLQLHILLGNFKSTLIFGCTLWNHLWIFSSCFNYVIEFILRIKDTYRGTWVAQLVMCLTLHFSSRLDLRVMSSSPALGSTKGVEPTSILKSCQGSPNHKWTRQAWGRVISSLAGSLKQASHGPRALQVNTFRTDSLSLSPKLSTNVTEVF